MSTKAQTKANRENAQKSTGPKTAEGKAVVSKNAVKHGLFAAETVITGENPADYEAYHDQFLAELVPVGMVESMLAERIISLAWRLQRADRMQNQVIEDMIERTVTSPAARRNRECYYLNQSIRPGDPRFDLDHLPLGRIATSDWSNCRVLDRMMMYERRIENSMYKTINKLKTQQMIRVIEQAEANKPKTIPVPIDDDRDEAATQNPTEEKNSDLKKQSQYTQAPMGTKSLMKGDYENMSTGRIEENKANSKPIQSQSPGFGLKSEAMSGQIVNNQ